jgi:hypothetical protein
MGLAEKLQLKPPGEIAILGAPDDVELDLPSAQASTEPKTATAVLAFVVKAADLDTVAAPAVDAARQDRLAWIAYPKAGQLGTDLNRDRLAVAARSLGVQPVRQVSIDEVWSALRFRPG